MAEINKGHITLHCIRRSDGLVLDLPDFTNMRYGVMLNDFATIGFDYPRGGFNAETLMIGQVNTEVFFRVDGVELPESRYYVRNSSQDRAYQEEQGSTNSFIGLSVKSRLLHTLIYPEGGIVSNVPTGYLSNERRMGGILTPNHNPWTLTKVFWDEAAARPGNAVAPLTITGTTNNDSTGQAWPAVAIERMANVGTTLWAWIKKFTDEGHFNVRQGSIGNPYALNFYVPGNTTVYPNLSDTVVIRAGRDITESRLDTDFGAYYSTILQEGANKRFFQARDTTHEVQYERREGFFSDTSLITDTDLSSKAIYTRNQLSKIAPTSKVIAYAVVGDDSYIPGVNYTVGCQIGVESSRYGLDVTSDFTKSVEVDLLIQGYTVIVDSSTQLIKTVSLTLVNKFPVMEEQLQQGVTTIEDGNTVINRGPIAVSATAANTTTTSTSYTDTGVVLSKTFTAPKSGRVLVVVTAENFNNVAAQAFTGFRISGINTVNASDARSSSLGGNVSAQYSRVCLQEGLTPGAVNTITMQHRVTSGTGSFINREIIVLPLD